MITEVFIPDVLQSVVNAMQVPVYGENPVVYHTINFEPGRHKHILEALENLDSASLGNLKYPLIAAVMPISEGIGSGFSEVTFPRIVIAHLTKSGDGNERVKDKYAADGVFKTILRPCLRQFIEKLAWSTYTNQGDPDAYEYTVKESPSEQPISEGLNDWVDIIEIQNLKVTLFSQIKTC
jgi:hypothetical protein